MTTLIRFTIGTLGFVGLVLALALAQGVGEAMAHGVVERLVP